MEEKQYPIPKNLNECFSILTEIFNDSEDKDIFQISTEDEFVVSLHHNFGGWIRNNWGVVDKKY